jgi:hypothetical protein
MPNSIENNGNIYLGFGQAQKYGRVKPVNTVQSEKCSRHTTHFGELDISFVLLNISSIFFFTFRVLLTTTQKDYQISK